MMSHQMILSSSTMKERHNLWSMRTRLLWCNYQHPITDNMLQQVMSRCPDICSAFLLQELEENQVPYHLHAIEILINQICFVHRWLPSRIIKCCNACDCSYPISAYRRSLRFWVQLSRVMCLKVKHLGLKYRHRVVSWESCRVSVVCCEMCVSAAAWLTTLDCWLFVMFYILKHSYLRHWTKRLKPFAS